MGRVIVVGLIIVAGLVTWKSGAIDSLLPGGSTAWFGSTVTPSPANPVPNPLITSNEAGIHCYFSTPGKTDKPNLTAAQADSIALRTTSEAPAAWRNLYGAPVSTTLARWHCLGQDELVYVIDVTPSANALPLLPDGSGKQESVAYIIADASTGHVLSDSSD